MKLTKRYNSYSSLLNSQLNADVYIIGSDQLWNSDYQCGLDPVFYLKFVERGNKISYATSVGKHDIDALNLEILKERLSDFNIISVREKSTSVLLTKVLGKNVTWVCDPVLLLPMDNYKQLVFDCKQYSPYAVVYLSDSCKALDFLVDYYKKKGLKIILLGGFTKRCYCDEHIMDAGPLDFLSLIYGADTVISSSFHATVFSHIFHKDFATIIPKRNGERINSLLELTGLEYRGLEPDTKDCGMLKQEIDWHKVDNRLSAHINDSKQYLKSALKHCHG